MSDHKPSDDQALFLNGRPVDDVIEVHEHVSPSSVYVKVLLALFVLTGLTYAVSFLDLGPASLAVAMIVAVAKATLVCTWFMHLKYDERYHVFVFLSSLLFVGIFFTFTIFDLANRDRVVDEQGTFFMRDQDEAQVSPAEKQRAEMEAKQAAEKAGGGDGGGEAH